MCICLNNFKLKNCNMPIFFRGKIMDLIINQSKLKSCVVNDKGELKMPKYLSELPLMEFSKEILKLIVSYCLKAETDVVPGSHFNVILDDNKIDFDREVVKALIELNTKGYIIISNI